MDPSNERNRAFSSGVDLIDDTIKLICENFEGEEMESALTDLKETFHTYQDLQEEWTKSCKCTSKLKDIADNNQLDLPFNVQEEYEKLLAERASKSSSKKKVSTEFQVKVNKNLVSKGDNDIEMTEAVINLIDPISKKTMINPVKNIHCNHTYDLDTITAMIKSKHGRRMMCPYQGCGNTIPLSSDDLITDELALRKLQQKVEAD